MTLAEELRTILSGGVDDSKETREKYSRDASLFRVVPEVVVRPRDVGDLKKLVRFVSRSREEGRKISLTPRAAGTDMSGGPLTESVVVDMLGFNKLLELGDGYAVVEPGMYFRDFDRETKAKGWELPSYTASRDICTVGGMVANDSGGEKNLKQGKTARYVEELEVVLSDGEVHTFKNYEGSTLEVKRNEQGLEGDLYKTVGELLTRNRDTIDSAKPGVEKNSSGYALWDIGDGRERLNFARLMVGSQGTLGIVTKIRFRLVRPTRFSSMAIFFVNDLKELGVLVPKILSHKPDSFESYDDNTFMLATKYFPEFALQMKSNIIGLGFAFLPEMWRLITSGVPKLVLLVEFRGDDQHETRTKAQALVDEVKTLNRNVSVFMAPNERAARKYWVVRHESFNLLRKKVRGKRTAPFIEDFVVPPQSLSEFLPRLNSILKEYNLTYTIAGHVGDGNFHIIPLLDPTRTDGKELVSELSERVYTLVLHYGGSISGEHNDGYARTPYVERMFGTAMVNLFKQVEALFDPLDVFNPNKKIVRGDVEPFAHLDLGGNAS